jgi:COP9 signalosome complex subunit 2
MLARKEAALKDYSRLMNEELSRPYISKSYAERSVNGMLEFLCCEDRHFMEQIYLNTVNGLEKIGNERALIKTNLKLAKLYIDSHQTDKASEIVSWLSAALEDTATSDSTRGTSLLELYSIHIQLYGETGNTQKLREYYNKALGVTTAIPHPRILGVIREYGGKMHMQESKHRFFFCNLTSINFRTMVFCTRRLF